ncbi:D-aminoacylase [Kwoniella heveanensis CBS 569]|nr:D-aminoacylase [Kwoniella heveanensis CBS 569]
MSFDPTSTLFSYSGPTSARESHAAIPIPIPRPRQSFTTSSFSLRSREETPHVEVDIIFVCATIMCGDETVEPFEADVLVSNGLIKIISPANPLSKAVPHSLSEDTRRTRIIQAKGYVLSPGFIDLHAHSDLYLLTHPAHGPKISQGCTTELLGQDGISYAPVETTHQLNAIRSQIAGWNGNPDSADYPAVQGLFEWRTFGGYLDCLENNGVATNVAALVPQGNLRLIACGPWDTIASPEEIEKQVVLLRQSMREGAVGMSSGLTYTPGMYASTSELASLCRSLADEFPGSFYAPHHRSYGHQAIESYQEMLLLGLATGCPIHLTHATLNFTENVGKAQLLLSMIDATIKGGIDISLDTYPYLPGCTTLSALLPSWASAGGPEQTLKRLQDEVCREKIRIAVEEVGCDGGHGIPINWNEIQIGTTSHPDLQVYSGRRISEIAHSLRSPPIQIFFEILVKDKLATSCIMHVGNEENVRAIMKHRTHCSGSDAILHGEGTHPRAYGTFPRFLGHYARDLSLISMNEMIAHLTSRPAKRLGIYPHRGLIAEGSAADLVLFDPSTIRDLATFDEPRKLCQGIRFVLVNGEVMLAEGAPVSGARRSGKVLRRRSDGTVS